jgi:subtilisin-like proprotein convertase family protein
MTTSLQKIVLIAVLTLLSTGTLFSQVAYSPRVDSIMNLTNEQIVALLNRQLTGDTATIIGGIPYTILSRQYASPHNPKAAQFIYERFQSFGLNTRYQTNSSSSVNVIAKITGSKYPNQQFIICAHYDDMPSGPLAPGADDNGSGTCAVIEAARLLSPYIFDYTLIFIAFDEEEIGLLGSKAYADTALMHGDSIVAVLNLDMIGWDSDNDYKNSIHTNTNSLNFANEFKNVMNVYQPTLDPALLNSMSGGSDHQSFWTRGYKAILSIEYTSDFNAYYHTVNDKFSNLNVPFFTKMLKASIASMLVSGWDYKINFAHDPLLSNNDTTNRTAVVVIKSNHPIAASETNSPKLYYKIGSGSFNPVNSFYSNLDTFKFSIPGQSFGTTVSYYLAAQDSLANFIGTYPYGGRGINPPGSTPPSSLFIYEVANNINTLNQCSNTTPKPIQDHQTTYDTISISEFGNVLDVNVNLTIDHTWDSDLDIYLIGPNGYQVELSTDNGGSGDNYTNTIFDDEASLSITQGSPPFTGSFRPEQPLSNLDNIPVTGNWILKVYDDGSGDQGQLVSWCVTAQHSIVSSVTGNNSNPSKYSLYQNYPNPFNPKTKIRFDLPKNSKVKLTVFDILGREVTTLINNVLEVGSHEVILDGSNLTSGVYFYEIVAGDYREMKKMVLLK